MSNKMAKRKRKAATKLPGPTWLDLYPWDLETDEERQYYFHMVQSKIATHGVFIQGVVGNPLWYYTVGLSVHDLPELMLLGAPVDVAAWMVNDVAKLAVARGGFTHGEELVDVLGDGYRLRLVDVLSEHHASYPISLAQRFYGDVRAQQILVQDMGYRYCYEQGSAYAQSMPLLGNAP